VSDYRTAVSALYGLEAFGMRLGLHNVSAYCERAGHPERAWPCFHVAGSNGKGTTAWCLAGLARGHGLRTGLYTSPHLVDVRERIRVDGRPIPKSALVRMWRKVGPFAEERAMTFFEAGTLIAFEWFAECEVDLAVIEVGLGGRLDATNVVSPEMTIVTNIALDHERHLGGDLPTIAREKAGIFKPGVPALVGDPGPPSVREALAGVAAERAALLAWLPEEARWQVRSMDRSSTVFDYASDRGRLDELELPVAGEQFAANAALALRAWELARGGIRPEVACYAVAATPPGRMEWRSVDQIPILFDVAHNPAALDRLIAALERVGSPRWAFVAGILADKRWSDMLDALLGFAPRGWLCGLTSANPGRRLAEEEAGPAIAERPGLAWAESVAHGLDGARSAVTAGKADAILVTGSFHTVGEALVALGLAKPDLPYERFACDTPPRAALAHGGAS
jgi:dihydrofolate synthase / folylpolyglutamate synthase